MITLFSLLHRHRLLHFVCIGGTGVLMNLVVTALLTELVFGRDRYFSAYLIGLLTNFVYNFILHTRLTFRSEAGHSRRFIYFLLYNIGMTTLQAALVRILVRRMGEDYYLPIIAIVILTFSAVTYFYYRFFLFRNKSG